MLQKKIFILVGHPDTDSLTMHLADLYEASALTAGHEVRRQNVGAMQFDPILHKGYKVIQGLEPDLVTFQQNVRWCDHFVIFYPNWWGTMPALLKGLLDRAWLPGFAFRMHPTGIWWEKLLRGRSARIVILANTPGWISWFFFGEFTNELARATLGFSGFAPVDVTVFAPAETASDLKKSRWKRCVARLGEKGK